MFLFCSSALFCLVSFYASLFVGIQLWRKLAIVDPLSGLPTTTERKLRIKMKWRL